MAREKTAVLVQGSGQRVLNAIAEYEEDKKCWPKIVLVDLPRSASIKDGNATSYGALEQCKNGLGHSNMYHGKQILMNTPHVIVFSNELPDGSMWSADRYDSTEITAELCEEETKENRKGLFPDEELESDEEVHPAPVRAEDKSNEEIVLSGSMTPLDEVSISMTPQIQPVQVRVPSCEEGLSDCEISREGTRQPCLCRHPKPWDIHEEPMMSFV